MAQLTAATPIEPGSRPSGTTTSGCGRHRSGAIATGLRHPELSARESAEHHVLASVASLTVVGIIAQGFEIYPVLSIHHDVVEIEKRYAHDFLCGFHRPVLAK